MQAEAQMDPNGSQVRLGPSGEMGLGHKLHKWDHRPKCGQAQTGQSAQMGPAKGPNGPKYSEEKEGTHTVDNVLRLELNVVGTCPRIKFASLTLALGTSRHPC